MGSEMCIRDRNKGLQVLLQVYSMELSEKMNFWKDIRMSNSLKILRLVPEIAKLKVDLDYWMVESQPNFERLKGN